MYQMNDSCYTDTLVLARAQIRVGPYIKSKTLLAQESIQRLYGV